MENRAQSIALLAGRALVAAIFLWSGYGKVTGFAGTQEYMAAQGLPVAGLLLVLAIFAELAGGISLLAGFLTRVGAVGLVVFMIPTTLIFHAFWSVEPDAQRIETIMFMKNTAIIGGLLALAASGPGRMSVDRLMKRSP